MQDTEALLQLFKQLTMCELQYAREPTRMYAGGRRAIARGEQNEQENKTGGIDGVHSTP